MASQELAPEGSPLRPRLKALAPEGSDEYLRRGPVARPEQPPTDAKTRLCSRGLFWMRRFDRIAAHLCARIARWQPRHSGECKMQVSEDIENAKECKHTPDHEKR